MDTYKEFCLRFWESTRNLDLYSMDGTQLDRLIVDALSKTNGGGELLKTLILISAFNHNNRKIQSPFLPSDLDEAAKKIAYGVCKQLPNGTEKDSIVYYAILAAKAGAEWMAGQGYTFETIMQEDEVDELVPTCPDMYNHGYSDGDKVIVQILKKH